MDVLQEITEWDIPNHTYWVLNSGKLTAYQIQGTSKKIVLNNPMSFDRARRRFRVVESIAEGAEAITVEGSSGKTYTIVSGRCSCPGFKFRGKCSHTAKLSGVVSE